VHAEVEESEELLPRLPELAWLAACWCWTPSVEVCEIVLHRPDDLAEVAVDQGRARVSEWVDERDRVKVAVDKGCVR
jgi:hypothetical protein